MAGTGWGLATAEQQRRGADGHPRGYQRSAGPAALIGWASCIPLPLHLADPDWRAVCWAPELNLSVAVSIDGSQRVMTSSDGISQGQVLQHKGHWAQRRTPPPERGGVKDPCSGHGPDP